jgi:hypothetical protein
MSTDPDGHDTDPGNTRSVPYALGACLAMAVIVVLVTAVILLFGGCTHPPDPLLVSADALNISAGLLTAKVEAHEAKVSADAEAAAARCAPLPDAARLACRSDAARAILDASAVERAHIAALLLLHQDAREALTLADRCRRDGATCETTATTQAVEALERLRAALAGSP